MPIEDARELWLASTPRSRAVRCGGLLTREDLNTGAAVGWADGVEPDALAARIRRDVAGVNVAAPGEVARQLAASTAFFSWLMAGIAGIGLLIGGLSLSNTVAASTFERIRDFGIKQALGASDLQLLGEVLRESLAVSLGGGILGTALAILLGTVIDARAARAGQELFLFSGRLIAFALGFAVVLGRRRRLRTGGSCGAPARRPSRSLRHHGRRSSGRPVRKRSALGRHPRGTPRGGPALAPGAGRRDRAVRIRKSTL